MFECCVFLMLYILSLAFAFVAGYQANRLRKDKRFEEISSVADEQTIKRQSKINREFINLMLYNGDEQPEEEE